MAIVVPSPSPGTPPKKILSNPYAWRTWAGVYPFGPTVASGAAPPAASIKRCCGMAIPGADTDSRSRLSSDSNRSAR